MTILFYRPFKLKVGCMFTETHGRFCMFIFSPTRYFFKCWFIFVARGCALYVPRFFLVAFLHLSLSDLLCELGYHVVFIAMAVMHVP